VSPTQKTGALKKPRQISLISRNTMREDSNGYSQPRISKNFVKDLCYAMELNGMGNDYMADTNKKTKREDMKNVKMAWKKFQVVAVTGTVGAGIDFRETL